MQTKKCEKEGGNKSETDCMTERSKFFYAENYKCKI